MNKDLNAVELEVFRQLFAAAAEEMGVRLMRAAYSPNIKERLDFSCALFDRRGDMIAQAAHIPVHLGSSPASVKAVIEAFASETMKPGERFVLNDPFAGGTHLPDVTVVAPVFFEQDTSPRFFVANRAHHADVGGAEPGSMALATHIDDEGVRLPATRWTDDAVRAFANQTRTPHERLGDLRAQAAATDAGIQRLHAMAERYGVAKLETAAAALLEHARRTTREALRAITPGTYRFVDMLDGDGFGHDDLAIRCTLRVELTGDAVFDFSETDPQCEGPLNAVRAITESAVLYALRCFAPHDLPDNSGILHAVDIRTKPGTLVDAEPPAAVAGGNVETSQRITDVLFGVLAQAMPDRMPAASCGTMNNVLIGSQPGDPEPFAYYETLAGGAGAGPDADGGDAIHTHMTNTRNTPVEAFEHAYPMRITRYAIRDGSGGDGLHCGGHGVIRRYTFDRPARVTLLLERRQHAPYGLHGGEPGATGGQRLISRDGVTRDLPAKGTFDVEPGDQLEVLTPGGGGYGVA